MSYKLSRDIYTLISVVEGAEWIDMKDMLNLPRGTRTSLAVTDKPHHCTCNSELKGLKDIVSSMAADILSLKESKTGIQLRITEEMKAIRSEFNDVKTPRRQQRELLERLWRRFLNGLRTL